VYAEEEDTRNKLSYQAWWICALAVTKENQSFPTKAYYEDKGIK
jgi:hypothetical protein